MRKRTVLYSSSVAALMFILCSPAAVSDPSLLAEGCTSCHGPEGVSQGPATPVISGLSRNYLIGALLAYKYTDDLSEAESIIEENPDLEDVIILGRPSTIMQHVARAYTLDEIKALADYFSNRDFVEQSQPADAARAKNGNKLHKKYCEKCHEEGGRSTEEDAGLLAGQWKSYLTFTLADFVAGEREMTKKMEKKIKDIRKKAGEQAISDLIESYISP